MMHGQAARIGILASAATNAHLTTASNATASIWMAPLGAAECEIDLFVRATNTDPPALLSLAACTSSSFSTTNTLINALSTLTAINSSAWNIFRFVFRTNDLGTNDYAVVGWTPSTNGTEFYKAVFREVALQESVGDGTTTTGAQVSHLSNTTHGALMGTYTP